jgi:hypothetical protein
MYTATAILSSILALDPTSTSPPMFDVADAEVVIGNNSAHLLAYDSEAEVSAEIIVWVDGDDRQHLDAVFADGLYMSTTIDGESVVIETDDSAEVSARAEAITDWLAGDPGAQGRTWLECGAKTLLAAGTCASLAAIFCVGGTVLAVCECLPLLSFGEAEC